MNDRSSAAESDRSGDPSHATFGDQSQLADLVDEMANHLESGRPVAIDSLIARCPALAEPLQAAYESLVGLHAAATLPQGEEGSKTRRLGDFRILRELGRGGMGIVYEAEQVSLQRSVAVKVLPLAGLLDGAQLARFKNEARAAAMLKHSNIVSVLSVGSERGVHYYAMELIDGLSLAEVIAATGRHASGKSPPALNSPSQETTPIAALSTERQSDRKKFYRTVGRLGVQAAEALHYAHQRGVIHRDVKPSNLMLDGDGNVHVTDFGLAQIHAENELTMTGDVVGTLRYMSPEQRDGEAVPDHRTDVYSLGLTLYELATGHAAFDATGREQLLRQVEQSEPPPPSRWDRALPRDLEKIIAKSIASRLDERYQSGRALSDDLERFLQGVPVTARPIGRVKRSCRWCLRNRAKAALFGLLSVIVLALAIGGPIVAWNQSAIAARQRHEAYDADMAAALQNIEHGEINQAVTLLRKHLPAADGDAGDYRAFEYFEMVQRCRRRLAATTIDLDYPVWGIAAAPNGDIATGSYFLSPAVFDSVTGTLRWKPRKEDRHRSVASNMAYSSDGRLLVTSSEDFTLKVWNAADGRLLHTEQLSKRPAGIAISSLGVVAVGLWAELGKSFPQIEPAPIRLYQLITNEAASTAELTRLGQLDGVVGVPYYVAFSPDGRLLASSSDDNSLRIWNVASQQIEKKFDDHHGPVMCVAWSPEGRQVCGSGGVFDGEWQTGETQLWDVETEQRIATFRQPQAVYGVCFTSDERIATSGLDRKIRLWDTVSGELVEEINAHADMTREISVFPTAPRIASASDDGTVRIWDVSQTAPRDVASAPDTLEFLDLAFSADGKQLATASADKAIRIWNVDSGKLAGKLGRHKHWATGVAYSHDGKLLASCGSDGPNNPEAISELKLWDAGDGQLLGTYPLDVPKAHSIAFSAHDEHIVIGARPPGRKGRILLWSVHQQEVVRQIDVVEGGFRTDFSRDGRHIGTTGGIWEYPSLEPVCRWPSDGGFGFDFHPTNNTVAVASDVDHTIVIRSAASGAVVRELRGHDDIILSLDYSPDGRRLASAGLSGVVIVWDLDTGIEIIRYRDHASWAWRAKFSPDGTVLASCDSGRVLLPKIHFRRAASPSDARHLLQGGR